MVLILLGLQLLEACRAVSFLPVIAVLAVSLQLETQHIFAAHSLLSELCRSTGCFLVELILPVTVSDQNLVLFYVL